MGRNTMTYLQKRQIVHASMEVVKSIAELQLVMMDSGNNTKECIRVNKIDILARNNVRYWIDRPILEITEDENRKLAHYLDEVWKAYQKEIYKQSVKETDNGR